MRAHPIDPMTPAEQTFSIWENPTEHNITLDLHVGSSHNNLSGRVRYTVPAKGEKIIPTELDMGVHDVRDGVIVGGLGTLLRKRGSVDALHPALDAARARETEAIAEAQAAMVAKAAAETAIMLATAKADAARRGADSVSPHQSKRKE